MSLFINKSSITTISQSLKTSQIDAGYIKHDEYMTTSPNNGAPCLILQSNASSDQQSLRASSKTRNQATIQDGRVVVQNVQGRQNQNQRYFTRGNGTAGNRGAQNRAGNANAGQGKPVMTSWAYCKPTENGAVLEWKGITLLDGEHGNTFDADVDNQPRQDFRSE
ncbi:hypothetical protein Tco_1093564 [Tanacetum coccineum]|uniref:Uncharacterized protein n=1 Tax=Tanacetum coccineum TaxID=301880 RepID=A0ABQ5ID30_9ASTR